MNADHDPTDRELLDAIVKCATEAGFSFEETRGIVLAEMANGVLRANCPRWLRRTQYFLASKGKLYPAELVAKAAALWLEHPDHLVEMGLPPNRDVFGGPAGAHRGAKD